jgi:hypothetical protein
VAQDRSTPALLLVANVSTLHHTSIPSASFILQCLQCLGTHLQLASALLDYTAIPQQAAGNSYHW